MKIRFYDPDDEKKPVSQAPAAVDAKRGFTLDWVHELHWRANPFTQVEAVPAHEFFVNQDVARQAINLFFIKEKSFGTINGDHGSGKSFLLQWLLEELQPYADRFEIHKFSAEISVEAFSELLVKPYSSLFSKYSGSTPQELSAFLKLKMKKKLVLLIDEADGLHALEPFIKVLMSQNNACVVLAGTKPHKIAPDELDVKLVSMTHHDAIKMLEKRISKVGGSGIKPFNPKLVEELWKAAKNTPVTFLSYCNETAMKIALKQVIIEEDVPEEFLMKSSTATQPTVSEPAPTKTKKTTEKKSEDKKVSRSQYDDLISGLVK